MVFICFFILKKIGDYRYRFPKKYWKIGKAGNIIGSPLKYRHNYVSTFFTYTLMVSWHIIHLLQIVCYHPYSTYLSNIRHLIM